MGAALGLALAAGRRRSCRSARPGVASTVSTDPGRRRHRRGHRLRRRHRRLPADGHDHERRRDPRPPGRAARRRPRRALRARPRGPGRRQRRHPAALLRRRAHPQPSGRGRHLDRPDARHDPRRPRAGGVRGAAVLARRRGRRAGPAHRAGAAPAADDRRRHGQPGAARAGARRSSAAPVTFLPAGEYVALGAARQAAWALSGAAEPPAWPLPERRDRRGRPRPPAYASATPTLRDRTADLDQLDRARRGTA